MKYILEERVENCGYGTDIDLDVDFQKLYDFVKCVNWSKSSLETNLDVINEFEKNPINYIGECLDLDRLMVEGKRYKINAINEIRKDFVEWIKNMG